MCITCQSNLCFGKKVTLIKHEHVFCEKCFKKLFYNNNIYPVCKIEIDKTKFDNRETTTIEAMLKISIENNIHKKHIYKII